MIGVATALLANAANPWEWFRTPTEREVSGSIPENLWITLQHAGWAVALSVVIAVPLAAWMAHRGRGELVAATIVNIGRVIPTLTILAVAVIFSLRQGFGFAPWPIVIALAAMCLPPIFANTYTAIRGVPPDAVAAAEAMGLSGLQILRQVELPLAVPLILAGIRIALTQAIATEALGALFGGGGLGVYVSLGLAANDNAEIQAGALLVAGTAMAADVVLAGIQRIVTPRGLRSMPVTRRRRIAPLAARPDLGGTS
jgi:osmoprotectant transport system permease protein